MEAVNVGGSENVAALAWKLGVPRLLSISSVVYFGGSPADGTPADEDSPLQLPLPTPYADTKHRGERAIQAWAQRGLATVTVFPALVYGPPGKKEGANALLRQLLLGRFPALVGADRRSSWVHLDDVVEALLRALERARPGARYLLAGECVTVRDLARRVAALGGAPVPRRELSVGAARWLLRLAAPLWRLRGRRPPLARAQLDALARHWCFDDRRARAELDWQPRGLDDGLPGTLEYLRRAG
jgi:nucleoside-diphosphate-sugar epimerase